LSYPFPVEVNVKSLTDFNSSTVDHKDYVYTFQGLGSRTYFLAQRTDAYVSYH